MNDIAHDKIDKQENQKPVKIFYSYSHKDERFRDVLATHLSLLKRQGLISEWHDRQIKPGDDWEKSIDYHLKDTDIILLLVSMDFIASDYCYEKEMKLAIKRHEQGDALIIPIILRPASWHSAPFGRFQALPKDGKPITTWRNRDSAWVNVIDGITKMIADFSTNKKTPQYPKDNVGTKNKTTNFGLLLKQYRNEYSGPQPLGSSHLRSQHKEKRGLTQVGLEYLLIENGYYISNGLVNKYEAGARKPPVDFIRIVGKVLTLNEEQIYALINAHMADYYLELWATHKGETPQE